MSNRHQRRRDLADFKRDAHRATHLVTHLIDVRADLSAYPMLAKVASAWGAAIPQRKPWCFSCEASFAKAAQPGAHLFATPPGAADIASVSVLCADCWRDLSLDQIEREATRVLRQLLLGGRFLDAGQVWR